MTKIMHSNIVTAFSATTIGSKVVDPSEFEKFLLDALAKHDTATDKVAGQHFIKMPSAAFETVSTGVGVRTDNPEDYILRSYRGMVDIYLRRESAAAVESLACVVYTIAAYLADPDIRQEEAARVQESGATHVLVAVLASTGPRAPHSPKRFVANLAGGNREAEVWTADEIRAKAIEVKAYHDRWCVVAD